MSTQMLHDRVAVVPDEPVTQLGSIIIPDAHAQSTLRGTVIAVGPGRIKNEKMVPMQVRAGDRVLYGWGGHESVIDGQKCLVFHEDDILAVID